MATVKKLMKKEYYPISNRVGLRLDIDKNTVSLYDPENPTVNKSEIRLFENRFFKSDWIKNLKDDLFFTRIKTDLIDTSNNLNQFTEKIVRPVDENGIMGPVEDQNCFNGSCTRSYSQELMDEYRRLIFPFLNIEVRKQNDLLYKNSLDGIDAETLNFYLQGIDDFEVNLVIDTLHKNYVDLKDVKVYEDYEMSGAIAYDVLETPFGKIIESQRFIAPYPFPGPEPADEIGGIVNYLLNIKMYGNLTTYKGKITK